MQLPNTKLTFYDYGNNSFVDRYTIIFEGKEYPSRMNGDFCFHHALGASENPFHPHGFGQHCEALKGDHLGKRITYADLPEQVREFVNQELNDKDMQYIKRNRHIAFYP
jgi:hypothetical protein